MLQQSLAQTPVPALKLGLLPKLPQLLNLLGQQNLASQILSVDRVVQGAIFNFESCQSHRHCFISFDLRILCECAGSA